MLEDLVSKQDSEKQKEFFDKCKDKLDQQYNYIQTIHRNHSEMRKSLCEIADYVKQIEDKLELLKPKNGLPSRFNIKGM